MYRLLALTLLLWAAPLVASSSLQMDTMIVQLRSGTDSNSTRLLDVMRKETASYLNSYFSAYYENIGNEDYFDEVLFTVNSFGIQGLTGSYINTIEFDGELTFTGDSLPSPQFVSNLLENAFKGSNLILFLEKIVDSDDPFLNDLTHIFVEINDSLVSEQQVGDSGGPVVSLKSSDGKGPKLDGWAEISMYCAAGVVVVILCLLLYCLCRNRCCKRQVQDEVDVVKVQTIEIPTAVETRRPSRHLKSSTYNNRNRSKSRPSRGRTARAPSPDRSLVSHDSSIFTHGTRRGIQNDAATMSIGSVSHLNVDVPNFDLGTWQKQNIISSAAPAPFGSDISAIGRPDQLSLIEEGDENSYRSGEKRERHSRRKTSSLEVRNSRSRRSQRPSRPNTFQDYSTDPSNLSSGDVINDLKNLALQIDSHRHSKSSRR